jgi:predicted nucleic acid-binding protein
LNKKSDHLTILVDCDVISHFIKGERLHLLRELYQDRLIILDVVRDELMRGPQQIRTTAENFISFHSVKVLPLPVDNVPCMKEFVRLLRTFGQGESACMAYARFNESIIASSNLKDIHAYCLENRIQYLTTMDILLEALDVQLISEIEANQFITQVKSQNNRLPVDTIKEYRKRIRQ